MTPEYDLVSKYDKLAAEIYNDKKYYFLTTGEIAKLRSISIDDVKASYKSAKNIIKFPDEAWLCGLSPRAKKAIKEKTPYTDFKRLYSDVMSESTDLECFSSIGHKVACEVRRWCISNAA